MNEVFLQLLPLLLGAMLVPVYPIVVLLLLQSQGGLGKAIAFVSGAIIVRLAQGVLFGVVFGAVAQTYPEYGPEIIASTLLLVIGVLLLVTAYRKWRRQADPDDPPPRWMAAPGRLTARRSLVAGALYVAISVKQWVFTLRAIDVIAGAALGTPASLAAYLLFTLATQTLVLLPIPGSAAAGQLALRNTLGCCQLQQRSPGSGQPHRRHQDHDELRNRWSGHRNGGLQQLLRVLSGERQ